MIPWNAGTIRGLLKPKAAFCYGNRLFSGALMTLCQAGVKDSSQLRDNLKPDFPDSPTRAIAARSVTFVLDVQKG